MQRFYIDTLKQTYYRGRYIRVYHLVTYTVYDIPIISMPMSRFGSYKTFIDALNSELESFPVETVSQIRTVKSNEFGKTRSFSQNKARNQLRF